jgi:hypothetical protein
MAAYYDNRDFTGFRYNQVDPVINFNWGSGAPAGLGVDNFSIRWMGQVMPMYDEVYTFYVRSDDGVRLWVNGIQIVDAWYNQPPTWHWGSVSLNGCQLYDIKMEFYERSGGSTVSMYWYSLSQAWEIVPQSNLWPGAALTDPEVEIVVPSTDGNLIPSIDQTRFEAEAWDPDVGMNNGDGIQRVEFRIRNSGGGTVFSSNEYNAAYCVFGGNGPCNTMGTSLWDSLPNDTYTIYARAHAIDGRKSVWDTRTFVMNRAPTPTPTITNTPTITPTPTVTSTPTITRTPTRTTTPSITPTPSNTPIPTWTPSITPTPDCDDIQVMSIWIDGDNIKVNVRNYNPVTVFLTDVHYEWTKTYSGQYVDWFKWEGQVIYWGNDSVPDTDVNGISANNLIPSGAQYTFRVDNDGIPPELGLNGTFSFDFTFDGRCSVQTTISRTSPTRTPTRTPTSTPTITSSPTPGPTKTPTLTPTASDTPPSDPTATTCGGFDC